MVFKYLLEDLEAARLLIGKIAKLEVAELVVRPQKTTVRRSPPPASHEDRDNALPLILLRMDFAARLRTADGSLRDVPVEIRKAPSPRVIEHFSIYPGQHLIRSGGTAGERVPPVVAICFLGYPMGLSEEAVVDVSPRVSKRCTARDLDATQSFVAGLYQQSHIVQIPYLRGRRRNDLERLLAVFDQDLADRGSASDHILSIDEAEYPADCGAVLRQLRKAGEREDVLRSMEAEEALL